jgi:Ca2+-binding EF-hand superfamily protein
MERPGRGGGGYDDDDDYAEYDGRPRRFQRRTGGRFGGYDDHDDYSRSRSTMPGRSGNSFVDRVRRAFRIIFRESLGNGAVRAKNVFGKEKLRDGKRIALQRIGLQFSISKGHADRSVTLAAFRGCLPNLLAVVKGGSDEVGIDISDRDFEDLVIAIDSDNDGKISYGELMSFISFESTELRDIVRRLARSIRAQGSDFEKTFSRLTSVNGSRVVSVQKLRDMIGHNLLTDLSDEETTTLMNWFDADGNGSVDLSEFRAFLTDYAGNLSRLCLQDDVMAITDVQMSSNAEEERVLQSRGYAPVKGGSLNDGSLGKRLLLWVRKQDLSKQIGAGQNSGSIKSRVSALDEPLLPIVDIRVHGMRRSAALYADGYDCLGVSVNAGLLHVGATNMYIWVKRKSPLSTKTRGSNDKDIHGDEDDDEAPILDLHITTGRARNLDSKLYELPSGGYMRVDCNFNHGGLFGRTVYLWYKKSSYGKMSEARKRQEFSRRNSVANVSRVEALRAEKALMNYNVPGTSSGSPKGLLTSNFQLQRMMYKVFDRARLAVRSYGIDQNTGQLHDPAKLFEDHSRLALHQVAMGTTPSRQYQRRFRFRGFRNAMRRAGVAINDRHMRLLMQQVDHDNDGYIEASDFTAFSHFAGHHLHDLASAVRSAVRTTFKLRFASRREDREDYRSPAAENSRHRGSDVYSADLEMVYDKYRGADPVLRCAGLVRMVSSITGVYLTHEESERMMGMLNHGDDRMQDALPADIEHPHPGTELSAIAARQAAKRGLSRDDWLEFMERGIHPHAPEGPGHRLTSAAALLQDYLRHVAVARMTVKRKQRRSQLSRAANQSGGAAALAVSANTGGVTGTPAQIQAEILQAGAEAAWCSMDPKGFPAVATNAKRSVMHLQTALQAASTWKGTGGMSTLSLNELVKLACIVHPQQGYAGEDMDFDDVGVPDDVGTAGEHRGLAEQQHDAVNRSPAALAATNAVSFDAMCHFAGIGIGSTTAVTRVVVTRSAEEECVALADGLWRANFNKCVIDPDASRAGFRSDEDQWRRGRYNIGGDRDRRRHSDRGGERQRMLQLHDATGAIQLWFGRETGMPTVKDVKISRGGSAGYNSRGRGEWQMAESPLDERRGLSLFYMTETSGQRDAATDMSMDDTDIIDNYLVSMTAASAFPGRIIGHSAILEGVSTTYVFEKVQGSEHIRAEGMALWRARARQTNAIYCLKERNAVGFKVGDHVYVKRTGFLNTSDGTVLSNQHKGETEGQIVTIVLPGNAGSNVKSSSASKATYDVRDTVNGTLLKGVREHLLRHVDDRFGEVEGGAATPIRPGSRPRRKRSLAQKGGNSRNLIKRVRDYIRETSRVTRNSTRNSTALVAGDFTDEEDDSADDFDQRGANRRRGERRRDGRRGEDGEKFDLISIFNDFVVGATSREFKQPTDHASSSSSSKRKKIRVKALTRAQGFTSLPPLRVASAQQCQDVATAMDVNGDGMVDFDDFMSFVGLAVHQLTMQRRDGQKLVRRSERLLRNRRPQRLQRERRRQQQQHQQQRRPIYIENSDDEFDFEEDWDHINRTTRMQQYETGPFIEDEDPLLAGVAALTMALRQRAKGRRTDLDYEISQWVQHIRSVERSGKGLSSGAVLVDATSQIDAMLRENEVKAIVRECKEHASTTSKWPSWTHLRKLILQYRGQGGSNTGTRYTRRLRRVFGGMRRVIQRMRNNGTEFYQLCEKYDAGVRGYVDVSSFRKLCAECGFGLKKKDFMLLKRVVGVGRDGTRRKGSSSSRDIHAIDYEALNRVLQPSWDQSDQSLQTLLNDSKHLGPQGLRPQFGNQDERNNILERRLQTALAASSNQRASLRLIFSRYDRNGDGIITPNQFINVCNNNLGLSLNDDDARLLIRLYTINRTDVIDYRKTHGNNASRQSAMIDYVKFCEAMRIAVDADPGFLQRTVRDAFARATSRGIVPQQLFVEADRNGSGRLSRRAFRKVVSGPLGVELSNEDKVVALMDKFDVAMDGFVDYAAFCRFASPNGALGGTGAFGTQGSIVDSAAFSKRLQRKIRELALYTNGANMNGKYHFDLRRPFERFDIARSGNISRGNFKKALADAGIGISNGEMAYIRDRFTGGTGAIDYNSFCRFAKCDEIEFDSLSQRIATRLDNIMHEGEC